MGLRINGRSPAEFRYKDKALSGLALGNRVVWKKNTGSFTIAIGINPQDAAKVKDIECTGDVLGKVVSATKDSYTFTVSLGGTATIKIVSETGYIVNRLNVNTVDQGAIDTYTFTEIKENNTMYLWMIAETIGAPTDFLVRSDKPDTYYSSLHVALKAIAVDYPGKLTADVTLSCVKKAIETRDPQDASKLTNERLFVSVLKNWNKNSLYTLTIDGEGKYTINGNSLGGICFENVDNVIVKNITFVDFANHVKYGVPEELAAIMFTGEGGSYASNLYITGCSFDGVYNGAGSYFSIVTKLTNNIFISDSTFCNNSGMTFKLTDTKLISLIKNNISGKQRVGITGHPGIFSNSGTTALYIEDNRINGATFNEVLFYINNTDSVYIRRNEFHSAVGRVMEVASNSQVSNFIFEANLLHDNMSTPVFPWIMDIISLVADTDNCEFKNNTVYFNGPLYRQWFARASANYCNKLINCNNIFIEATTANTVNSVYAFKGVKVYIAKHNIYKSSVKEGSDTRFFNMQIMASENPDSNPEYLAITGNDARDMAYYTNKGYEQNSFVLSKTVKLLNIETGGSTYGLISSTANNYQAETLYLTEFDINYRQNLYMSSIGAINHNGVSWDETTDASTGYKGLNAQSKVIFSEREDYIVPSDDVIILCSNTKNRSAFVRFYLKGSANSYIGLGRNTHFVPTCLLKTDETYDNTQTYNIEIEKV